ncbi:MAG: DegT/DnrJ/EryC1/StrS aminotransferase family protein [Paludibacter sp.]|nr:DegT/DnrJ/EryC1/StrS aminotransferase family protein [Paludibacter sp.]
MNIENMYKKKLSAYTEGNEELFFYWKGRVALYAILKSMGVDEGDEVILPAFTCVVVPNAIIYAGAKPIYVDIIPETYNMDISKLENAINEKTKVIICQNTFGLSSNIEEIIALAQKFNLYTIEDCTHGFGGYYNEKFNGTNCDSAFFSTQWNKPFSTGIGGFALINNFGLLEKIKLLEKNKIRPSLFDNLNILFLILARKIFVNSFTYWIVLKLYRFLSVKGIVLGSSSNDELNSIEMPVHFFKGMSKVQLIIGIYESNRLEKLIERRKRNATLYSEFLFIHKKNHVVKNLFNNHSFLKYPILVKNREVFFETARVNKIELGDWFISPLHPIKKDFVKWKFDINDFPIAEKMSEHIVNLPLEKKNIIRVLRFLESNMDNLM